MQYTILCVCISIICHSTVCVNSMKMSTWLLRKYRKIMKYSRVRVVCCLVIINESVLLVVWGLIFTTYSSL